MLAGWAILTRLGPRFRVGRLLSGARQVSLAEAHALASSATPRYVRVHGRITSDEEFPDEHDLSSLRILGSTGEPWDPDSYLWYFEHVGKRRCPIINISGGTEIVGCLLSPLPIMPLKPCSLGGPGLGMDVDVFDDDGKPIRGGIGHLVCKQPAPSMTKGFLKDPQRYLETYFSRWPGVWYHGDWAKVDEDGQWFLFGRSDDTIKVAGKRTGPAEVEAALIEHPSVAEAAAIGVPHEVKGETVVCFVVLKPGSQPSEPLREELKGQVVKHLGKTLKPEALKFVKMLPKTRSAKIVRGAIRKKYLGQPVGDLASVENPAALDEPFTRPEIAERVAKTLKVPVQEVPGGGWGSNRKLAAIPVGTRLSAAVRGLACGPRERAFWVRVEDVAVDELSLGTLADLVGDRPLGRTSDEVRTSLELIRSTRRIVALAG